MESLGVLILRLTLGPILALHGSRQFLGWFGGGTMEELLRRLGFRPAKLWASLGGLGNLAAAVMLTLGALTFIGCALIVTTMVVALVAVKAQHGFWERDGGYEYNLVIIGIATAIGLVGPGPFSLDAAVAPALIKPELFLLALLICLSVAALGLCRRVPSSSH
jgi:putative oxidoreductase